MKIEQLKELAIAYELSNEFDYVPNENQYEDAKKYYGVFDISILQKYSGERYDEIANKIITIIKDL